MKTILSKLSDEQARAEIVKFTWASLVCAVLGLLVFRFIGAFALLFGGRAFTLSFHKGSKKLSKLWMYRIISLFAALLGWLEAAVALSGVLK